MSKDPFQILADELTLIRKDMDHLQRTSLNKQEAENLHSFLSKAVLEVHRDIEKAPEAIRSALKADRDRMAQNATQAATAAAERVLGDIREQLARERQTLSQAAGEARRQAWRYFGGFWVWLVAMLATGAFLGLLAAHATETAKSLLTVEQMIRYSCGSSWFGGQVVEQDNGSSFCAFWIKRPDQ